MGGPQAAAIQIQAVIQRVGRIEVANNPNFEWLGTGFLAGADTVITNRHVAMEFAQASMPGQWKFRAPMTAAVDFKSEFGSAERQFAFKEIVGIHDTHDLAVLRVAQTSGTTALADPLPVADKSPATLSSAQGVRDRLSRLGRATERPGADAAHLLRDLQRQAAAAGRNLRRDVEAFEINHDCSTLGGNSGSPVIDLETHRVLGLHFGGRYMEKNHAVPLWTLQNDR